MEWSLIIFSICISCTPFTAIIVHYLTWCKRRYKFIVFGRQESTILWHLLTIIWFLSKIYFFGFPRCEAWSKSFHFFEMFLFIHMLGKQVNKRKHVWWSVMMPQHYVITITILYFLLLTKRRSYFSVYLNGRRLV